MFMRAATGCCWFCRVMVGWEMGLLENGGLNWAVPQNSSGASRAVSASNASAVWVHCNRRRH